LATGTALFVDVAVGVFVDVAVGVFVNVAAGVFVGVAAGAGDVVSDVTSGVTALGAAELPASLTAKRAASTNTHTPDTPTSSSNAFRFAATSTTRAISAAAPPSAGSDSSASSPSTDASNSMRGSMDRGNRSSLFPLMTPSRLRTSRRSGTLAMRGL